MIEYYIDDNKILKVNFLGEIDFTLIAKWLDEFSEMQNLPPNLYSIYDLRKANLKLDLANLIKVIKKTEKATASYKHIRTAFLIKGSKLKEYGILFSFLKSNNRTIRKAFSEPDAAYKWIMKEKERLFDILPED